MSGTDGRIVRRVVAEGTIVLDSPAHFGGGDSGAPGEPDMALLRDGDGKPLLQGSSFAGCLRNMLASRLQEGRAAGPKLEDEAPLLHRLFGEPSRFSGAGPEGAVADADEGGAQGCLIVDDVRFMGGSGQQLTSRQDYVRIDECTGTAVDEAKFDIEVLNSGAHGTVRLELVLRAPDAGHAELLLLFQSTLDLLSHGDVRLGAKTRRGFGRVRVAKWSVRRYDFNQAAHALAWLSGAGDVPVATDKVGAAAELFPTSKAELTLTFALRSPMLVRSAPDDTSAEEDVVQFRRRNAANPASELTIPSSSWSGVIRGRAGRIARTLGLPAGEDSFIEAMFGPLHREKSLKKGAGLFASRVSVEESVLSGMECVSQPRNRINRFTGGVAAGALFLEGPAVPAEGEEPHVELRLSIDRPQEYQVALLMLVAKDLWSGDLAVGGVSSIGHGVLAGRSGTLTHGERTWAFHSIDDDATKIAFSDAEGANAPQKYGTAAELETTYGDAWRAWLANPESRNGTP